MITYCETPKGVSQLKEGQNMYLTEHFASFIAHTNYEDLPQDVIVQAKERIMDTVGAAIAGCCNWEYA